jgi:hypothetical protein
MRLALSLVLIAGFLGGCTVGEDPYPAGWDPLSPLTGADCRHFQGTYADRGQAGHTGQASLSRELFGKDGPWQAAENVHFSFPQPDLLDVTVTPAPKPFVRRFSAKAGELRCEGGALYLRNRRWVYSDLMSGREDVKVELYRSGNYLVAHVNETMMGAMFMVVPLTGESTRWYRFSRLTP